MLHVIRARCAARVLHTIALEPLERTYWRQFAAQWIAPLNAINNNNNKIIIIIIIIIIVIIIILLSVYWHYLRPRYFIHCSLHQPLNY